MEKYVAFIRAINVAGHARVRMNDVKDVFTAGGCKDVSTIIQSGNVIFQAPESDAGAIFETVRTGLGKLVGEAPAIVFRRLRDICRIVKQNPFIDLSDEFDTKRYVVFLSERPRKKPRLPLRSSAECLEAVSMKNLELFIIGRRRPNGFFGFPNNFIERELGVPATARNWSTVSRIAELGRG